MKKIFYLIGTILTLVLAYFFLFNTEIDGKNFIPDNYEIKSAIINFYDGKTIEKPIKKEDGYKVIDLLKSKKYEAINADSVSYNKTYIFYGCKIDSSCQEDYLLHIFYRDDDSILVSVVFNGKSTSRKALSKDGNEEIIKLLKEFEN